MSWRDDPSQFVYQRRLTGLITRVTIIADDSVSFEPGKFPHMPVVPRDQMDPGRSDETVVPISVFEEICAHGGAWRPATDWSTLAIDYL